MRDSLTFSQKADPTLTGDIEMTSPTMHRAIEGAAHFAPNTHPN